MSLLLTSNTPRNDITAEVIGINRPFSYQNHLQDTFRIPKNAEVAVQSVKINRNGAIALPRNTQFGIFFGQQIPDGINPNNANAPNQLYNQYDINSVVVPTYAAGEGALTPPQFDMNTGNASDVAEFIERAGNRALCHPNLCKNASSLLNPGFTCEPLRNASSFDFLGWKISMTSAPQQLPANNKKSVNWQRGIFRQEDQYDYNIVTDVLTNTGTVAADDDFYVGTDYPISLADGVFNCSINYTLGEYKEIGLVRGIETIANINSCPPYWDDAEEDFIDWTYTIEGASGTIKVWHSVNSRDFATQGPQDDEFVRVEYDYRAMNGNAYFIANGSGTGPGAQPPISRVAFHCNGEKIDLFVTDNTGTTKQLTEIAGGGGAIVATNNASNVKPTCMTTRWLYPRIYLQAGETVGIRDWSGVDVEGHVFGGFADDPNNLNMGIPTYQDWFNQTSVATPGGLRACRDFDLGYFSKLQIGNFVGYKTLNANNQIDYDLILAMAPANKYLFTKSLNAQRFLGFEYRSWAERTTQDGGTPFTFRWESDKAPELKATNSVFVRLKNFNINSVNFSKSQKSNILYHLPAFSNTGLSTGALYFEPTERTYLKLNNTLEEFISTVEIDLVYADETLAKDLAGKTVVMLHIREAR